MRNLLIILVFFLTGCAGVVHSQEDCANADGYGFICGPTNAEDLVRVPGTDWVIASGMAEGTSLFLVNAQSRVWNALYPGRLPRARQDLARYGACPGTPDPNDFQTHGLSIRGHGAGRATLYAVGHGGREAIEVFDVDTRRGSPVLTWIGCVLMPAGLDANSVVSMRDGSILATVLIHPDKTFFEAISGQPTGGVYKWSPGQSGFTLLEGSSLPANNGIELSADEREIFVAVSGLHTVVALANGNPTRVLRSTRELDVTPDNIRLGRDGRLVMAGMLNEDPVCGSIIDPATFDLEKIGACPRPFKAYAVDPRTMAVELIGGGPATDGFSNTTIALEVGNDLWLGTFAGDRIAIRPRQD